MLLNIHMYLFVGRLQSENNKERQTFLTLKLISEIYKWKLMDQIIRNFYHLRSCQAYNAQSGHYYTLTNQVKSLYVPPTHAASRAVKWRWHQRSCDESMIFVIGARRPLWRDEQQKMVVLPAAVGAISSTYLEWPVIRLGNVCDNDLFFLPLLHICYSTSTTTTMWTWTTYKPVFSTVNKELSKYNGCCKGRQQGRVVVEWPLSLPLSSSLQMTILLEEEKK